MVCSGDAGCPRTEARQGQRYPTDEDILAEGGTPEMETRWGRRHLELDVP